MRAGAPPPSPDAPHYSQEIDGYRLKAERHTEFLRLKIISARIWPRRSRAAISGERDRERRRGLARFVAGPNPVGDPCRGRARNRLAAKGRAHRRMARFARHAGRRDGFRPARRRLHGFFDRRRWIQPFADHRQRHDAGPGGPKPAAPRRNRSLSHAGAARLSARAGADGRTEQARKRIARCDHRASPRGRGGRGAICSNALRIWPPQSKICQSASQFRFAAAASYHELVGRRIDELREDRLEGLQTFSEFFDRRLQPAMRTCRVVVERQADLSARVARTTELLSTRVEISSQRQKSRSARTPWTAARNCNCAYKRLSKVSRSPRSPTTSFLWSAKARKRWAPQDLKVDPAISMGVAIPIVALIVAIGVARIRRSVAKTFDKH